MAIRSLILLNVLIAATSIQAADAPTYERQIAPFFKTYCVGCHDGGDDSKGGLNLLTHRDLMAGGDGGDVIVAGKSGESRLVGMLVGTEKPRMPPKDSKQPKPEEIELVKRWVDLGAKGPSTVIAQSVDELSLPQIEPRVSVAAAVTSLKYSPDGRWLIAARHRDVLLIDVATGRIARTLTGAENPVNAVAVSPDGRWVAAAEGFPSVVGKVRLWDIGSGEKASTAVAAPADGGASSKSADSATAATRTLTGHIDSVYSLAFSPDGSQLVTASYDKLLILWDVAAGIEKHTLKHHTGAVFGVAFSPDGQSLASVAADQTVKLWNVATGQRILTLIEPTKGMNAVAFHPRGHELAAAGTDKMIRVYDWNGTTAKLKRSAFAHDAPVLALAYSPDGQTLFSASEDRLVKAWDVAALRERHVYDRLADWPLTLAVHPAGDQLAVGLFNGELSIFDVRSPKKLRAGISVAGRARSVPASMPVGRYIRNSEFGDVSRAPPCSPFLRGGGAVLSLIAAFIGQQPAQPANVAEEKPNPPTPRLDAVSPRTVVRGNKVKFTLSGQNISAADRVQVSGNLQATLLPSDPKNANQAFCEIDIPGDMAAGSINVRLHTPFGSAGTKPFYVGPFPEMAEKEDNDARDKATPVKTPATLTGAIGSRGDRDWWSFDTKAGEELVFLLVGPNLGSVLQARLSLLDDTGRRLDTAVRHPARNDVVLGHRFESTRKVFLQVEDRDNGGSGNHFYAIHAGPFPYVTNFWPLAMRATDQGQAAPGEVAALQLTGFNLLPGTKLHSIPGAGSRSVAPFTRTGKSLNAVRYEASPFPEFAERESNDTPQSAQPLSVPGAVSGRIAPHEPGVGSQTSEVIDQDHFSFMARRGDRLTIETVARRLGSPIDTVLDILDSEGRPVPRATVRSVAETYIVLRDHDSRNKGMRLQNWDDLQPNDYVMAGGEIVRVQSLPLGPDADVQFADHNAARMGFFGTTPEAHALNSAVFKVEIHPPGMTFPPNGMPVVTLNWRNDDATGLMGDSQVLFDAPADGAYIARVRDVRDLAGDDFVYRLVVRPRREDFRITLDPENPNVPRGGSLPVTVNVERLDGFAGPVEVRVEGLPAGVTATPTRIGRDKFTGILTLTAAADAPPLAVQNRQAGAGLSPDGIKAEVPVLRVYGTAIIEDKPVEHSTSPGIGGHVVTVTLPPDLKVTVEPIYAEISPGQQLRFTVTIERKNAFKGRVPVDVMNLPHGLRVLDVGLNGVLINENETSRAFVLTCDPWVEPGSILFYAAGRVESKTERHAATPIRLEVKTPQIATKSPQLPTGERGASAP